MEFSEIIKGSDILQGLLEGKLGENAERRSTTIRSYLVAQHKDDEEVRFKQVELQNKLIDLFVDIPLRIIRSASREDRDFIFFQDDIFESELEGRFTHRRNFPEAVATLVRPFFKERFSKVVIEGAPGQGKSTIGQFLCQIHRMILLNYEYEISKLPPQYRNIEVQFPIRIDLRDYAAWINRQNPFTPGTALTNIPEHAPALESFIASQISYLSGGQIFSASDFAQFCRSSRLLVVLDGFDEIADTKTRERVVAEISRTASRLTAISSGAQFIVTSRPAVFANSPGFPEKEWHHFELEAMTPTQIELYSKKWMSARHLSKKETNEFSNVLDQKMSQPHLRDLARNPMQLAILLALIHTRGLSLPDKRTALYDEYMELFFSREAEKSAVVRDHRDLLVDLHRYLAWLLHVDAERGGGRGSIEDERLKVTLRTYLEREGHPTNLVDELFTGMVERVVALVSRVQGTFEFEVQPLREYFAARYLYETAPYSPPGQEKRGTKPDRFDAIAKNFYWLNVARFFAGCFSKGELASLLTSLEQLSQDRPYNHLAHPLALAWMLLSDWVFSQQPTVLRRVVEFITSSPRFLLLLATASNDRSTFSLALPERCGKQELLSACVDKFKRANEGHVTSILAQVLSANLDQEQILKLWSDLKPSGKQGIEKWLAQGSAFDVFAKIDIEHGSKLFELCGPPVVSRYLSNHRYDLCCASAPIFQESVSQLLRRPSIVVRYADHDQIRQSVLIRMCEAFAPYSYYDVFHGASDVALIVAIRNRARSGDPLIGPVAIPPGVAPEIEVGCTEIATLFDRLSALPAKFWARSLDPWSELVELARRHWGDSYTIFELATLSAGVRVKLDSKKSFNLFDESISLCERARIARLKSGAPGWWSNQISNATTSSHRFFIALLALAWATPRTMSKISKELSHCLDELAVYEWEKINSISAFISGAVARQRKNVLRQDDLRAIKSASPRFLVGLASRIDEGSADSLFVSRLASYRGVDEVVLAFCVFRSRRCAEKGLITWETFLQNAKRLHKARRTAFVRVLGSQHRKSGMPLPVAKKVCAKPEEFPIVLVSEAQYVIQKDVGSNVGTVGSVADKERWFHA